MLGFFFFLPITAARIVLKCIMTSQMLPIDSSQRLVLSLFPAVFLWCSSTPNWTRLESIKNRDTRWGHLQPAQVCCFNESARQ